MEELAAGIWHWTAPHPRISILVHSYYFPQEQTLVDPIAPAPLVGLTQGRAVRFGL